MASVPRIGNYELREPLGSTGLTETYRARGRRSGNARAVALKLLRLDRLPSGARASVSERFLAAGRAAQAATVGGMAQVVDTGQDAAGPFVASELLPGIDLVGLVHFARKRSDGERALDPALAGALGAQVARILTSAHESSPALPHLGLCPSNVRITPTAGIAVTDFGLAAAARGQGEPRIARWHFCAPELIAADPSAETEADLQRADIYSLGALLYYLLAGKPPFEAETLSALVERAWEPPAPLPSTPENLDRAIRALMAPEPKQRPPSIREAAEMLDHDAVSPQERRQLIETALRSLDINWRSKRPGRAEGDASFAQAGPNSTGYSHATVRGGWAKTLIILVTVAVALAVAGIALRRNAKKRSTDSGTAKAVSTAPIAYNTEEIPPGVEPWAPPELDGGMPTDRVFVPAPTRKLPRVPGRLDLDTSPSGADVWVDGVLRGTAPVDLDLGPGGHRVVLIKEGFRLFKEVYDTSNGEWLRVPLRRAVVMPASGAYLNVMCRGASRYPILVDDEETGRLCPAAMLQVTPGPHKISVFVPSRRSFVDLEINVPPGGKPLPVTLKD